MRSSSLQRGEDSKRGRLGLHPDRPAPCRVSESPLLRPDNHSSILQGWGTHSHTELDCCLGEYSWGPAETCPLSLVLSLFRIPPLMPPAPALAITHLPFHFLSQQPRITVGGQHTACPLSRSCPCTCHALSWEGLPSCLPLTHLRTLLVDPLV